MLNKKNFGLAGGILWGSALFFVTLISLWTGYANELSGILKAVYPGYSISMLGSIIGLAYGFLDGFIGLYIFAWIYNVLEKKTR